MAHYDSSRLILNPNEMERFRNNIARPTPETVRLRDALFAELEQMRVIENEDGSVSIDFEIADVPTEKEMTQATSPKMQVIVSDIGKRNLEVAETSILAA